MQSRVSTSVIQLAADRLHEARRTSTACEPVRDLIGSSDLAAAYAVQAELTARRVAAGARIVGRKIGLTSTAVQLQLGVDQPDLGVLFADMEFVGGETIPADAILQPKAEAEIAFVLDKDLDKGPLDTAQVREAIDYGVAALEICGSRIAGWDISFGDTVADNASSGAYVLGPRRKTLDEFEPRDVEMTMMVDGEWVSTGQGVACLGDPIEAVVWLARTARELGDPLRAGEVILSGALGPMHPVQAGNSVTANITTLGAVNVRFSKGESS